MIFAIAALVLCTIQPAFTTFYSKTDKICDPAGSKFTTYTGFRIHREYIVNGLKSPIVHFNSISHCDQSVVDFERVIAVERDVDIEFNKPFCLLKPSYLANNDGEFGLKSSVNDEFTFDKGRFGGTIIRRAQDEEKFYDFTEIQDLHMSFDQVEVEQQQQQREQNSSNVVSNYSAMKYVMDFAQGLFAKMTTTKKFGEYIGRRKFLSLNDFEILTPPQLSLIDFEQDFICYNMVRRKKYAKRKMGIYAPYRFIGGIFECSISNGYRDEIMESYKKSLKTPVFKCDANNSIPIAPLISDDISKQWFQISAGAHIMQRIPYLYSPTSRDPRFQNLFSEDSWFEGLDVNEEYIYQPSEIGIITKAITDTSNAVCNMLLSMEKLVQKDNDGLAQRMIKNLESRFLTSISLDEEPEAAAKLESLENMWDHVDI